MKAYKLYSAVSVGFYAFFSTTASAALIDRGGGLIYDNDQDITWLQNAGARGFATWNDANDWTNTLVFGGFDDWRLPTTPQMDSTCTSVNTTDWLTYENCTGGEMGHLYYTELGNTPSPNYIDSLSNDYGPFSNISLKTGYWTSTAFDPTLDWPTDTGAMIPTTDSYYWLFYMNSGKKFVYGEGNSRLVWAVRDGDVSAVPIPGAIWLMGSGLGSLILLFGRKKSTT